MYRLKTAHYSFEMPLRIGAVLAGAGREELAALSSYAIPLGTAFQITDDILGAVGDERKTGKSAIDDLAQGKQTVPLAVARRYQLGEKAIAEIFKKQRVSIEDVRRLRRLFLKTGATKIALRRARAETARAKQALTFFKSRPRRYHENGLSFLEELADFITERIA
jgi:geranylgeranyl pyrophosphate synthase